MGNYFVAKDESCAWKLQAGDDAALIYGNTEKLMDKVEVVVYPKKIPWAATASSASTYRA